MQTCIFLTHSLLTKTCFLLIQSLMMTLSLYLPHPYLGLLPCSIVSLSLWCREQLQTVLAASPLNQAQDPVKRTTKIQLQVKKKALLHLYCWIFKWGIFCCIFKWGIFLRSPLHLFVGWFEIWHYPHVEHRHSHLPPDMSYTLSLSPCRVNQQEKWLKT